MTTLGELLSSRRKAKNISLIRVSRDLLIKIEDLEALESGDFQKLPEPTFVKGFLKSYASYLGMDSDHVLALYRREYDEKKYPKKTSVFSKQKNPKWTPVRFLNLAIFVMVVAFVAYLLIQYLTVTAAPKLKVISPPDDLTTTVPVVEVAGQTEKETTISVNGQLVPVDADGSFSYQYKLADGQNIIEIIASKKVLPKTKVTKVVRLAR